MNQSIRKPAAPVFKPAVKLEAKLRLAFIGPSGSGKTYSALSVAENLGARVAVVDTEHRSAAKYADRFSFDALELDSFHPERYVEAIEAAEAAGYDVIVLDSLSHAWMGKDGALEQKDMAARRMRDNGFAAWREVTPMHNRLVEAILGAKMHVIATMRSKTEWVVEENEQGKKTPRKIGLAPIQRDGMEFEFDVVGDLDQDNVYTISKTRCPALKRACIKEPGAQLAKTLKEWLEAGAPVPPAPPVDTSTSDLKEHLGRERARLLGATSVSAGAVMWRTDILPMLAGLDTKSEPDREKVLGQVAAYIDAAEKKPTREAGSEG